MNAKQKFFATALAGAIIALALLIQAVCKFGFWVLFPLSAVCIGSMCGNYLIHEYKKECKYGRKVSRKTAYTNSDAGFRQTESTQETEIFIISQKTL